jgi:RNA polymerase-binding transcription factor DksA
MNLSELKIKKEKLMALKEDMIHRLNLLDESKKGLSNPLPESLDDQAVVDENSEVIEKLSKHDQEELQSINIALAKIITGTFSICSTCGNKIESKRLKALPYAVNCIECENG